MAPQSDPESGDYPVTVPTDLNLVEVNDRLVQAIKADVRNLLTLYMQGTPDRLPPAQALAEALALAQLSQEIFNLPLRESGELL